MDSPLRDKIFVGRQWVFERLCDHLESQPVESARRSSTSSNSKKPTVFIAGSAGSGKTALLTEICFSKNSDSQRQYQLRKRVLAYHFCSSQHKRTLTLSDFLDNIAVQLSKSPFLPKAAYGEKFCRPSESEPNQLMHDPDLIFREMILKKVCEVNKSSNRHLYIVIDGLDESYEQQLEMGELSSGSKTIAELLAAHVDQFPPWLHILTSSRRCSKNVVKMFATNKKIYIDDYKKEHIVNDFKLYMRACLLNEVQVIDDTKQKDFQVVFETLHEKSNGCFLYLEFVIQALAQCVINTREIRNIPNSLNGLYSFLFLRYYRTQYAIHANTEELDLVTMRQILSVLVASQTPMSRFDILDALVTRECSKPYNPNHLEWQIRSMGFFIWKDKGVGFDEQCIQLAHHSFMTWITDAKLCGRDVVVDASEGHAMLALSAACFYDLNRVTSSDIQEIIHNLSQSLPAFAPSLNVEMMALWVLWIGLDSDKFNFHAPADSVAEKIISLASDHFSNSQPFEDDSLGNENENENEHAAIMRTKISYQDVTDVDHHGQTLLMRHLAAGGANTKRLIDAGSNINHEDMSGWSPLIVAAKCGSYDPVEMLLKAGAEVNHKDYEGWTALRSAVWEGFYDIVCLLLSNGAHVDLEDNDQRTPLRAASWRGFEDIARVLVQYGANVNQTDRFGQTPLNAAAYMGNCAIVDLLLSSGARVDQTDQDGRTALTIACLYDQHQVARRLLETGADVNHQDKERISPLTAAAYKGNLETVKLLLNHPISADLHLNAELVDNGGRTALLAAASQGHLDVVRLLIVLGSADCTVTDPDGRSLLSVSCVQGNLDLVQWVLDSEYDEGSRDFCGWTPMHVAAFEGRVEVCKALLRAGLSVNDTDDEGRSPLICAAQEGHLDVVNFLVESGASIDHIAANSGQNALRVAALENHSLVVEYLLASGSNINLHDKDGRTTLYVLAQEDKIEMSKLFLEWRADVHLKDHDGRSPLMVAAWQGHFEMCQFLIEHGADINCVDIECRSVLQMAAWQGHLSIIRLLCESGVDINSMCSQGATALTIAAQEGHTDVIECLLHFGADPLIQDKHGRSAYKMAMLSRNVQVKELMERAVDFNNRHNVNRRDSTIEENNNNIGKTKNSSRSGTPMRSVPHEQRRTSTPQPQLTRVNSFQSQRPNSIEQSTKNFNPNHQSPSPTRAPPRREAPPPPSRIHAFMSSPVPNQQPHTCSISNANTPVHQGSNNKKMDQKITPSLSSGSPFSSLDNSSGEKASMKAKFEQLRVASTDATGNSSNVRSRLMEDILNGAKPQPISHEYPNLRSFNNSVSLNQFPNLQTFQTQNPSPVPVQQFGVPRPVANLSAIPTSTSLQEPFQATAYSNTPGPPVLNTDNNNALAAAASQARKPDNPMYIDVRQLQKSILMQARKQELEDRERKSKKRRKRNLFTKIHGLLGFNKSNKSAGDENAKNDKATASSTTVLSDDEFSVSAFANSNCNTPRADQFTNINQFSFASPGGARKIDRYSFIMSSQNKPPSAATDNSISDKKSEDYRRLVDLSHLRTVDPLTSRSFRNYDRLGAIKAIRAQQQQNEINRNYVPMTFQNTRPNMTSGTQNLSGQMSPANVTTGAGPMLAEQAQYASNSNSKKSYYISLAEIKKVPSRKPPPPPEDVSKWFPPRGNKPPGVPERKPKMMPNVFEHVNGMSKVVPQNQLIGGHYVPNVASEQNSAMTSKSNPNNLSMSKPASAGPVRTYVNQHEMIHRFHNRFSSGTPLETIEEPAGTTLESRASHS